MICSSSQENPILIGGPGRSGTTLLAVMLDSHRNIFCGSELHFRGEKTLKNPSRNFFARVDRFGVSRFEVEAMIENEPSPLIDFSDKCSLIDKICKKAMLNQKKDRWGFKIMGDISLPEIYAEVWGNAQFVNLVRDGRDVFASQKNFNWGWKTVEKAASVWSNKIKEAREASFKFGLSYKEIKLERIIDSPERSLREILNFLREQWDSDVLDYYSKEHVLYQTLVKHPSRTQAEKPLSKESIGRYKKELTKHEIERFNECAGDLLQRMGYEV